MGQVAPRDAGDYLCDAMNLILRKMVINRLPPKTLLWARFADSIALPAGCETGLDLGCGAGSQLPFDKMRWFGADLDFSSLLQAHRKGKYEGLVCTNVNNIDSTFRSRSVDVVVAFDFIEHLDRAQGTRIIKQMEAIARDPVVILVPNGYVRQDARIVSAKPLMEHRSAWHPEDFHALGYCVKGWSGWKAFAGPGGVIRLRIDALFQILMTMSQPLVRERPDQAFHLLCWKDLGLKSV